MSGIEHASVRSIKPFKSSEKYLYAMKEDLAEWLGDLYNIDIHVNNILDVLETGALLCAHANNVTRVADEFQKTVGPAEMPLPASGVTFVSSAHPTTFLARDNVTNFINWCRKEMSVPDVLMFETDDLVLRKNEKNFVLCLLEVARRAYRFGMASPVLIQLEQEIEDEIREEMEETIQPKPQRSLINSQNLDEMVKFLISRCTCPSQFPMVKVSDGKYRVGDSNTLIFVRILRNHVMVRVGGGWDTLEHYLDKHDPCLCASLIHKLTQRPATPVHEIKERLTKPQSDAQCGSQTTLLLSRSQSPLQPVVWSSSSSYRTQRAGPSPPRSSYSPDPEHQPTRRRNSPSPNKLRERPNSPSHMHTCTDSKDTRITDSSSRKGREATRSSPMPRLSTSLPRASHCPTTPQPEIQRPQTPLVLQRNHNQNQPLQGPEKNLGQTWTKLHFVSKLRQNSSTGVKGRESQDKRQLISNGKECLSPGIQSWLPKPPNITIKEPEDNGGPQRSLGFIHKFSPTKGLTGVISEGQYTWPRTPTKKSTGDGFLNANEKTELEKRRTRSVKVQSQILQVPNMVSPSHVNISSNSYRSVPDSPKSKTGGKEGGIEGGYRYTLSPISPAQEANLYKSLEEEILSNLQQLSIDSDTNSSTDENLAGTPQRSGEISSDRCKVLSPKKFENHEQTTCIPSFTTHKPNSDLGASFDAVVAELSSAQRKMEKASVEKWVTTLPATLNGKVKEDHTASSHLKVSKPSMTTSCSSLGSSMDSKDTGELVKVSMDVKRKMLHGKASSELPKKQKSSLLKRRRSLKKPERVPSIYKLKLRPCVQPRRDHRSDQKPSKIPKPVFYKKISCQDESCPRQRENDFSIESLSSEHGNTWTKPKSQAQVQSTKKCPRTNQESHANHNLESWV
ncbi:GAS2-like protein 2 [Triplophysa tibetana]|uniref:GAS2-like protein 2 n=1 Tax=Triplophysa tibetana TaxID=1572043 RepID=A0A5A9P5I4_9TELE|nr:GAS2-like protein 2 [Triplophysa tibetana]